MSNIQFRVIRVKGYDSLYIAQKRIFKFFWLNMCYPSMLDFAEYLIDNEISRIKQKKANPRAVVIKTYEIKND